MQWWPRAKGWTSVEEDLEHKLQYDQAILIFQGTFKVKASSFVNHRVMYFFLMRKEDGCIYKLHWFFFFFFQSLLCLNISSFVFVFLHSEKG